MLNRYRGTGWRFRELNSSGVSVPWTTPGGWADCDMRTFSMANIPSIGNVVRSLTLDPGLVSQWVNGPDSQNYGLLLRASGSASFTVSSSGASTIYKRPALEIVYSLDPNPSNPPEVYPITYSNSARTIWVDFTAGSDLTGNGDSSYPVKSLQRALSDAMNGDTIYLLNGTYPGPITVTQSGLTIQSAPGHWASISSPLNDPVESNNVIEFRDTVQSGVLRNLDISGGYYYGIMFWTQWEDYPSEAENVYLAAAASNILVENVRFHHTGSSCVKMVMKVSNITFRNCEFSHCGERYRNYGHGVEAVQTHGLTVEDCYIHDLPGAGVHLIAGSINTRILRNFISNVQFGMNIGFTADYDEIDTIHNPILYESLNTIVANNIISRTLDAGINLWASFNASIVYNTIWNAQESAQSAILIDSYEQIDIPGTPVIGCSQLLIVGNILTKSRTSLAGAVLSIRAGGFNASSSLIVAQNIYFDFKGIAGPVFQFNHGAMFEDDRYNFLGNITMWRSHCQLVMQQPHCDVGSVEANPLLGSNFAPLPCSPALSLSAQAVSVEAISSFLSSSDFITDFNGQLRPGFQGVGAVSRASHSAPAGKALPPVPPVIAAAPPPYSGKGLPAYNYDTSAWPFGFWGSRRCVDLYVDPVHGTDAQAFNYQSNYTTFRTIMGALISINQCDRVLLKGNSTHVGPIGICNYTLTNTNLKAYVFLLFSSDRPNVTIMTDPRDSVRATVVCENIGESPCLITGNGLFDGAAEVTLSNFNMVMSGESFSTCIQLNEGNGGAYTPFWEFYVKNSGFQNYSRLCE